MGMLADMVVVQVELVGMLAVLLAVVVDTDELLVADKHVLVEGHKVDRGYCTLVLGRQTV